MNEMTGAEIENELQRLAVDQESFQILQDSYNQIKEYIEEAFQ